MGNGDKGLVGKAFSNSLLDKIICDNIRRQRQKEGEEERVKKDGGKVEEKSNKPVLKSKLAVASSIINIFEFLNNALPRHINCFCPKLKSVPPNNSLNRLFVKKEWIFIKTYLL